MILKSQVILVLALLITGCAAPMSKDGLQVREIQRDGTNSCKFISVVEASGGFIYSSLPEAKRDMLNKLRNEVAQLGGNALVITTSVVEKGFSTPFAQADAYKCPAN
jgi:hypothetical protein